LRKENEKLIEENNFLRNELGKYLNFYENTFYEEEDTALGQNYVFTAAKVINNSINKQYNYITINKGSKHEIDIDMAVISSDGVVGKVKAVSKNYSTIISLINRDLIISSKLKNSNYFGPLSWEGDSYREAKLKEIPYHVQLNKGDTIVTSGYSANFPENILIGKILDFKLEGGNFYKITIELFTDFKNLSNIYVITNLSREERIELEETNK